MLKKYVYHDVNFRGTIERVRYTTHNPEGEVREKYANVYLPYGYDPNGEKRYNVLYLMHGGGGNPDAWLDCSMVKNMLDYCFFEKEAEPFIVVFPSFYKEQISRIGKPVAAVEWQKVQDFIPETVSELLPAVESRYRSFAESVDEAGLCASRAHRGFGGFSMGSCTTWYQFLRNLPCFSVFLPFSGDCWALVPQGGGSMPAETADVLARAALDGIKAGFDFQIFAATGSEDPALPHMRPQIEQMKRHPVFAFSEDPAVGNLHFEVAEGERHAYECVYNYLYSYLPILFQ